MNLLPLNLAKIADIADKRDSSRFALSGVHLRIHGDNTFVAEATDSKKLIRVTGPCVGPLDEYPVHAGVAAAPNGEMESLVPASAWKSAFGMGKKIKGKSPILKSVAVSIGKEVTTFGATDLDAYPMEQSRNLEGRFPPTADIIGQNVKGAKFLFAVDPKHLAALLTTMASLSENPDGARVEFSQVDPFKPVSLKLAGCSGELSVEAIVMPLCPEKWQVGSEGKDEIYENKIEKLEKEVRELKRQLSAKAETEAEKSEAVLAA